MNIVMLEWSYELLQAFQCDIMKKYVSAPDHFMKLRFNNYVHIPCMNQIFQYRYACNVGEVYIFEHGLYISALEHARMLILSEYVLLASINTIYIYCHAWMIFVKCMQSFNFGSLGSISQL